MPEDVIKIEGYTEVVPNEIYKQDIEIISPYNYVLENGIIKPEVTAKHTKVFAFARFNGLKRAVLEKMVQEAEIAASIHTGTDFSESGMMKHFYETHRLGPYIHPKSNIQRVLLRMHYRNIVRLIDKGYAALESMNSREEMLTTITRNAEQSPDTLIIRFGEIPCTELETEETSNPFFSVGEQIREEASAGRCKRHLNIPLYLKNGKLSDKDKLYIIQSKAMHEEYPEIKNALEGLFNHFASGLDSIELVPVRDLTADVIEGCVFVSIKQL